MSAEGVYIPKEQNSTEINQFRPSSLLNVGGKIFFSVMASRLIKYLTEIGYVNVSVQKGNLPGVSGCLQQITMIWEAIQRAKSG
ncbi:reverse transcriptase [Plakobranchus ocellatus]|uniref:Reverse transcriptase n=1 Tax=Plakobranchus ocellatus TaxID=259542 RepID=A0AAV3ZAR4_9GAST|nr:reverse transcriptase [Plakobranchus ocellatus]